MTNASTRPTKDHIWALEEWLKVPSLNPVEISVLQFMLLELRRGASWDQVRQTAVQAWWLQIMSAITKARTYGVLKEWRKEDA